MILPLIGQEGGGGLDLIWWLLPVACCLLTMGQRDERTRDTAKESETFYTTLNIDESFKVIEEKMTQWRQDEEDKKDIQQGIVASIRNLMSGGRRIDRFTELDNKPPRLYSVNDTTGPVIFEFTEVEGGGAVVKITYNSILKTRMSRLKADLPLKIPAMPIGLKCPSCAKPVLEEFNLCPYCGAELIKE